LTEVRAVIEPNAAAFAATRASRADVALLEDAFTDMVKAIERSDGSDYDAFDEADMRFHLAIVRASGNDLLEQMTRVVYSALAVSFRTTSRLPGSARRSLPKHRAILRAIADGQPDKAMAAMERLVSGTAREISQLPDGDRDDETGGQERDRHGRRPGDRSRNRGTTRGGGRAGHVLRSPQRRG
jgi:DNA-binding FadR family transcriptional regulator